MKYSNITFGQIEAIINKLGGEENFNLVLKGNLKFEYVSQLELLSKKIKKIEDEAMYSFFKTSYYELKKELISKTKLLSLIDSIFEKFGFVFDDYFSKRYLNLFDRVMSGDKGPHAADYTCTCAHFLRINTYPKRILEEARLRKDV